MPILALFLAPVLCLWLMWPILSYLIGVLLVAIVAPVFIAFKFASTDKSAFYIRTISGIVACAIIAALAYGLISGAAFNSTSIGIAHVSDAVCNSDSELQEIIDSKYPNSPAQFMLTNSEWRARLIELCKYKSIGVEY